MWMLDRDSFVVLLIITKIVWVRVYFDCVRVIIWLEEYEGHDLSSVLLHTFLVPVMKLITKKQKGFNGRKGSWVKPLCQIDRAGAMEERIRLNSSLTRIPPVSSDCTRQVPSPHSALFVVPRPQITLYNVNSEITWTWHRYDIAIKANLMYLYSLVM